MTKQNHTNTNGYNKIEFRQFIKTFLINLCYRSYCEIVYSKNDNPTKETSKQYRTQLVEFKYDEEVWNRVFADIFDVLKYYYKITKNNPEFRVVAQQNQMIEIYKRFTFEEYLERLFLPYSADEEYQNYLSLIKTSEIEKKKIENKYSVEIDKILLMNHLVYLVNSLIDNNKTEFDSYINIIPFYEHIGAKGLTLEYIEEIADHRYETTMALDEIQEFNVFNIIRKILL
jgi:hypothetical protein